MNQKNVKTFVKKIKVSDYVALRLANEGVKSVFAVSGGASLHLIHSVDSNREINLLQEKLKNLDIKTSSKNGEYKKNI